MRVYLGSDHNGYELKRLLIGRLRELGHDPVDCGPMEYNQTDDYPPYVIEAAQRVAADEGSLGVVIGGSGNGEQIAANKVAGIRAALAWNDETARLAREHNNANVIGLGTSTIPDLARSVRMVEIFVGTPFSEAVRHARRISMISAFEETGVVPAGESRIA